MKSTRKTLYYRMNSLNEQWWLAIGKSYALLIVLVYTKITDGVLEENQWKGKTTIKKIITTCLRIESRYL